eukprot:s3149_g3.t1
MYHSALDCAATQGDNFWVHHQLVGIMRWQRWRPYEPKNDTSMSSLNYHSARCEDSVTRVENLRTNRYLELLCLVATDLYFMAGGTWCGPLDGRGDLTGTCFDMDVYRLQTSDFDEPETLEVFYNDGKGGTLREIVFVDPIYADRRPRICVSIDGIQAMHKTISTLTRKVDNLVETLQRCRGAYYKELSMLREQIYQQALVLRDGCPAQTGVAATLYDPSAFISQTESEVDLEVQKKTEALSLKVRGLETENLRLKKRVAILSIEVTHLESLATSGASKKSSSNAEVSTALTMAATPYGANFVRQDMRRRKKTCASKGLKSKRMNQLYDKDGRMKRKYSNAPEPITAAPTSRKQERAQRHQHQTLAAIRSSSLLKIKTKTEPRTFSDALTPELLATLQVWLAR